MKKLLSVGIFVMLFTMVVNAQTPELKFDNTVFDFGSVQEEGGRVTATFEFINDGNAPLVINDVRASCGCTVADWTREPVAANKKGFIQVMYNPKGRPGSFNKSVTVTSNASSDPVRLSIKGNVIRQAE